MSTPALSLLSKSLDHLDGKALDETGMGEWAAAQIADVTRKGLSPEDLHKARLHIKGQIDAAIAAFGKGEKFFTPQEFVAKVASPLEAAKAKLAKELEAGTTPTTPAAATKTGEEVEGAGESEAAADPNAAAETPATKAKPTRKAAPETIGKDFFEADEKDPWPDTIGGSMQDVAVGPGGKVYTREK